MINILIFLMVRYFRGQYSFGSFGLLVTWPDSKTKGTASSRSLIFLLVFSSQVTSPLIQLLLPLKTLSYWKASCGGIFLDYSIASLGCFAKNLGISKSIYVEFLGAIIVVEIAISKGWHSLWLECDSTCWAGFL